MKINLIENFRALFYAPFYATFELGAFKAEGLDVVMTTPSEFGNSLRALAAGGAADWSFFYLRPAPGTLAALAVRGGGWRPVLRNATAALRPD